MSRRILRSLVVMGLALLGPTGTANLPAQNQPGLVINDVTVAETNGGSVVATFTVSFADTTGHGPAFVSITTTAGTATTGSQCGGSGVDFIGVSGQLLVTLSAAERSKQINITVCGDTRDEPDQTFFVNITARGAAVQDGQGLGTIIDDDPPPVLSISDGTRGESPTALFIAFGVSLVGSTENVVSVRYATADRSAIGGVCGIHGVDYEKTSSSITLPSNFIPGSAAATPVRICGDSVSEGDQQFEIHLSNAINATIQDATGVVTITDDEPLPTLSITPSVMVNEPGALVPQAQAVFTVTLTGPPTEQPVSVQYATAPGTAIGGQACPGSTLQGADYITQTGTLTFTAAKSTQEIQVPICSDSTTNELSETFSVTLMRAANAAITQAVGIATIQ
jgi:hypothetical protein